MSERVRQRIPYARKGVPAITDHMEFVKNLCSISAKLVNTINCNYKTEIWMDKHFFHRHHSGENDGTIREGIEPEIIEDFVIKAIPYLVLFSTMIKGFHFVNNKSYNNEENAVVLRLIIDGQLPLNVAIITHLVDLHHYQITVKTAMKEENFKMWAGQYYIDFEEDMVSLRKFENKEHKKICEI